MSHKVEVRENSRSTWTGNSLRFATYAEVEGYAADLFSRWFGISDYRTVESTDPVTHVWNWNTKKAEAI